MCGWVQSVYDFMCVSVSVCAKVCAATTSKPNKFSTCELLFLILSEPSPFTFACVCVFVACVINFWHLNWTPSTSKVLNQFDKFAFFSLQENQKQNNEMGKTARGGGVEVERGSKRKAQKNPISFTNYKLMG